MYSHDYSFRIKFCGKGVFYMGNLSCCYSDKSFELSLVFNAYSSIVEVNYKDLLPIKQAAGFALVFPGIIDGRKNGIFIEQ